MGNNYYAKRNVVFRRPLTTKKQDGTFSTTMGFQVCFASDGVKSDDIAKMLNFADAAEALLKDGPDAPLFKAEAAKLLKEYE